MNPICITGMHRSGTSMVARAAQTLGLWLGQPDDLVPPAPDNPDGFFENAALVRATEALFDCLGGGWDCPPVLIDDWTGSAPVAFARGLAAPAIAELASHSHWGWKDPRAAAVLPFWTELVPGLRVVGCLRNPLEVAASLRARNGTSLALGLQLWFRHMEALLSIAETDRLVTHYDAWFHQPEAEATRLGSFAGLTPDSSQLAIAAKVPARHARHAKFDARSVRSAGLDPALRELYERLCAEAGWADGASSSSNSGSDGEAAATVETAVAQTITVNGSLNGGAAAGRVLRAVVDVGLAQHEVHKRNGRVAQLERRVAELEAELQAGSADATAPVASSSTLPDPAVDRLQAGLYDVQLAIGELAARIGNRIDRETADRDVAYLRMIRAVRADVLRQVPADADILVISENEPALVDLHGRAARHFPVGPSSDAPGPRPAGDTALVAHLLALQARGATHLVIPPTANWWTTAYAAFATRLADASTLVESTVGGATIRRLSNPTEQSLFLTAGEAIRVAERRLGKQPTVLDWTSKDLAGVNSFSPPDNAPELGYIDASIDVVAIDSAAAGARLAEAKRVASAGVLIGSPDGWTWLWTAPPTPVTADVIVLAARFTIDSGSVAAYAKALLATLPPGFCGRLTVAARAGGLAPWKTALGEWDRPSQQGEVTVIEATAGPSAALRGLAERGGDEPVAVIDGSALPVDGWLPTLLAALSSNDRIGLVAARRRAFAGAPIIASSLFTANGLVPVDGVEGDSLTKTIDIAVPGAFVTRRSLLAAGFESIEPFTSIEFALAALCRQVVAAGYDVVVQPEADVVDLGLGEDPGPGPGARADTERFTAAWTAVAAP